MVSLRSQYRSRVDVAYLDPPYNTGRDDLWYSDRRFQDPNADANDAIYIGSEDGGRHTKWLNYMGPRLHLVWELLADHGVCFVSINDVELFRLGMLMDEIFHERNRIGVVVWKGAIDNNPTRIVAEHEYVLVYAKNKDLIDKVWTGEHEAQPWLTATYQELRAKHGDDLDALQKAYQAAISQHVRRYNAEVKENGATDLVDLGRAKRYRFVDLHGPYAAEDNTHNPKPGGKTYDVLHPVTGRVVKKPSNGYRFPRDRFEQLLRDDRIVFGPDETTLFKVKAYVSELTGPLRSVISLPAKAGTLRLQSLLPDADARFMHPKPVELIEQLVSFGGNRNAVVLDPFAGSGTTGHAVMSLNAKDGGSRRFLLVEEGTQQKRYARTLTAARLRTAITNEGLPGGFVFEATGKRVNRDVILEASRAGQVGSHLTGAVCLSCDDDPRGSAWMVVTAQRRRRSVKVFPALGGERWWPLTATAVILRTPIDVVMKKMRSADPTHDRWEQARDLDQLLQQSAPLLANWDGDLCYVATADQSTVVLATAMTDLIQWMAVRADKDLRCAMIGVSFCPSTRNVSPSATFHVQSAPRRWRRLDRERDARTVGPIRDTSQWFWDDRGAARPYENAEAYRASRPADRLPKGVLASYLSAEGVPVADPGYLCGPAWLARRRTPSHSVDTWSTIAELRSRLGYPQTGMRETLLR